MYEIKMLELPAYNDSNPHDVMRELLSHKISSMSLPKSKPGNPKKLLHDKLNGYIWYSKNGQLTPFFEYHIKPFNLSCNNFLGFPGLDLGNDMLDILCDNNSLITSCGLLSL
jgi:hypothetical protein